MINLSELKVIEDAFFRSNLNYYKPSLYNLIEKHFKEENEFSEATIVKLNNIIQEKKEHAHNLLLKRDLDKIKDALKHSQKQFDDQLWKDMLPKIREEIKKTLGLNFKPRPLYFEEHFPHGLISFELKGASSITIFEGQENSGIYFLKKRVSSFTPILLIHEQIHTCLSQNKTKDQIYIEWFEEGITQWFSIKIFYNLTKNIDLLNTFKERYFIYSKVKDENNLTKRYYEYMKIMSRIFLHGGDKFIAKIFLDYMSNNREKVNKYLDIKKLNIKKKPKTEIENFLVNFTFEIEPEKLPPIEYIILEKTIKPKTIESIFREIKAPQQLIEAAIFALNLKGFIFLKNNIIEINWRKKDLFEKGLIKPFWPVN
ncbi:MAG: hypothetical protein QXE31_02925 [Candidatus Woesearchaeota archaeon]